MGKEKSALIPAFSPREKEKRLPRPGKITAIDLRRFRGPMREFLRGNLPTKWSAGLRPGPMSRIVKRAVSETGARIARFRGSMRECLCGNRSPFCSGDSAKRGDGETLAALSDCEATGLTDSVRMYTRRIGPAQDTKCLVRWKIEGLS